MSGAKKEVAREQWTKQPCVGSRMPKLHRCALHATIRVDIAGERPGRELLDGDDAYSRRPNKPMTNAHAY